MRRDEGELCGGIPTVDVRDERYEVNHCSETEEISNLVERWKDDGVGWNGREYQRQLIDQENKGRRLAAWSTAVITTVPKCTPVSGVSDLRPISVTPIYREWSSGW